MTLALISVALLVLALLLCTTPSRVPEQKLIWLSQAQFSAAITATGCFPENRNCRDQHAGSGRPIEPVANSVFSLGRFQDGKKVGISFRFANTTK
jgi:hypothetical protein